MTIDRLVIGAIWPIVYGAIYLGLQTFVSAQWPDTPPAYVLGIMALLGGLQGAIRLLWPQTPAAPDGAAAAPRGMVAPETPKAQPGKVARFFI